ncbi:MAG: YnbE family lipoprotein [Sphingomonadaceae bacterium]|nr:YnbE family lipoprotein [Sphingomonadaceae bacterium]
MTDWQLTLRHAPATSLSMNGTRRFQAAKGQGACRLLMLVAGMAMLAGCVSVNAPDGPIVIELNINIRSEVVYRLANDASETIEDNADIF